MKTTPLYAALDLHCNQSVLGSMDHDGNLLGQTRFGTDAGQLKEQIAALGSKHRRPVYLTLEAGSLTRWAVGIVRPLVERVIICDPRHNRLINSNPNKSDEVDVGGMCLLLRVGKLKEVWMGSERTREIYRALVYELLNWRDAQRELKALEDETPEAALIRELKEELAIDVAESCLAPLTFASPRALHSK